MAQNDLLNFMHQVSKGLADEYERIRSRSLEDPGTAGDQGEENWALLLREWLPATYHIVTKGRIMASDGRAGPQVDVLVLSPAYPSFLVSKKLYLTGGVLAAFECKTTLEAAHVTDAVETAIAIRDLLPAREGSPYKELFSPITFGLLAHSHNWKGKNSTPANNIEARLLADDRKLVHHPRQMLDVLCVADLACWSTTRLVSLGPNKTSITAYVQHSEEIGESFPPENRKPGFTPIGALLTSLLSRLAWEDASLRDLSIFFRSSQLDGNGRGLQRSWPVSIYSEAIRPQIMSGMTSGGGYWDEWCRAFF